MFCPELTFRPRLSVLGPAQIEQIHQATLELLERTGFQVAHPRALEMLHGAGRTGGWKARAAALLDGRKRDPFGALSSRPRQSQRRAHCVPRGRQVLVRSSVDCIDYLDPLTTNGAGSQAKIAA